MSRISQDYYAVSAGQDWPRPSLSGTINTDICIIGAGYTGLSAALHAAEAGARVVVLEAETVGYAASGRNGGQIHTGLRKDQSELETWLGRAHARDLWNLTEEAKSLIHVLVARHGIECDLKPGLVIAAHNKAAVHALANDTEHLATFYRYPHARMMDAEETAAQLGTRTYPAARWDSGGGHLHPLRFARGLAIAAEKAGTTLYEQSRVLSIDTNRDGVVVKCSDGRVVADRVLLATDAFTGSIAPELDRFIGHVESFVTATAPLPKSLVNEILVCDAAVADTRHVLDYYRKSADGRLLFAGREAYFRAPSDIAGLVRPRMLQVFPQLKDIPTEYAWSGTVGITVTRMPHFGRFNERVLFAYGYSGQGVALATLGGMLLAEAALGSPERFDVFARVPARAFPGGRLLRKPLVAAALFAFKILDSA